MRKIVYKELSIQNFLSVGKDKITIPFPKGMHLITGKDLDNPERKNGAGKSTIVEAFHYAVFGETIRKIKKEFVPNNKTKGKGIIELIFDVITSNNKSSYKIVRTLKPSSATLYKCGDKEEDISRDSIANTNKYITELVGSNTIVCKSCDILSISDSSSFMAKKPEEKRKFIEDVFTMEVFGKMMKELKDLIKENNSDYSIQNTKVQEIVSNIAMLDRQRVKVEQDVKNREQIIKSKKKTLQDKIDNLKLMISELKIDEKDQILEKISKTEADMVKVSDKLMKIGDNRRKISTIIQDLKDYVKKIDNIDNVTCEECLQDITKEHSDHLESIKVEKNEKIKENEAKLADFLKKISDLNDLYSKLSKNSNNYNKQLKVIEENEIKLVEYNRSLSEYEENMIELDSSMEETSESLTRFDEMIEESKTRLETESKSLDILTQRKEDYDVCKFVLGDDGLKSFLVKRLLKMLNGSIQKYINSLGMTMRCSFDEFFEEKLSNNEGAEVSYWNFSGGERRTIDLACAWAFKDIRKKLSGVSSNVEFIDEYLDFALDERGLDLMIELLKSRIDNDSMCCYVISHRKETSKHIDGITVELEKRNKITRRIR